MEDKTSAYPTQPIIQESRPINWRKYLFLFLKNWYWFLIMIFIAISIAYFKNRYTLPIYSATATILIEDEEASNDVLNEIRSVRRMRRNTDLANELAKLDAFSLHLRTVDSLRWDISWSGHGRVAMLRPIYSNPPYYIDIDSSSARWYEDQLFYVEKYGESKCKLYNRNEIDTIIPINTWIEIDGWKFKIYRSEFDAGYASYSFSIRKPTTIAREMKSKMNYLIDEQNGTVITISSQGHIAQEEIDYINAFCENYRNAGLEWRHQIADNTLTFLEDQIKIIQDSVIMAENQLLYFRVNNKIVDLSTEGQQVYNKLYNFYEQKTELKLQKNYYEYLQDYITNRENPQAVITPTLVDANDQLLIEAVQNLQELYEERELLGFSAEMENPELKQINTRIQSARNKILDILEGLIYNNDLTWKQIETEEQQIESELLQLPLNEQELLNIQRKYDVNNQFYTFLLQKRAEAGIQKASTISNVRILDKASFNTIETMGIKKSVIFLFALIVGILVPFGIIILSDYMDTTIKDRSDIEVNSDLPILGVVAHEKSGEFIPVQSRPGAAFTESFRHIRTNLQYILREPHQKVIMVTSTISGEGKTFIATNLATIHAMNNRKVLLVGLDLRKPFLHKVFNLDQSEGISTYLSGQTKLTDIIHPTNIEGLDVTIAGPVPPNPAELIETDNMKNLIKETTNKYEFIVVDTPPVALVTDALLISKYAHTSIFVIRQNYSQKASLEMINNIKAKEVLLLVNDIKEPKALGYRYYYGYGYGYGYGYNYRYKYTSGYYQTEEEETT